jgi:hypothetical protein
MRRLLYALLLLTTPPVCAESFVLTPDEWSRPRSGESIVQQPVLSALRQAFEREADSVIVIAHATGEAGQLWAEEVRAWLVALGISSARIRLNARPEMKAVLDMSVRNVADL